MASITEDIITSTAADTAVLVNSADPIAYLRAGVLVWLTGEGVGAFVMSGTPRGEILIGGIVRSGSNGITANTSLSALQSITVLSTGSIHAQATAIDGSGAAFELSNAGTIEGRLAAIDIFAASRSVIHNSGTLAVTDASVAIYGAAGADRIINTGTIIGNVQLSTGNDLFNTARGTLIGTVSGDAGDDVFQIGENDIAIVERVGEGIDRVEAGFNYELGSNIEDLTLVGAAVTGVGNTLDNVIIGNRRANTLQGGAGDDELIGGDGNDRLFGGDGADLLFGDAGTNTVDGGAGNDTIFAEAGSTNSLNGGEGDDVIYAAEGNRDAINGSAGFDTLVVQSNGPATTSLATGTTSYGATLNAIENVNGGGQADTITGNDVANVLSGGGGNDALYGGGGNDTLRGGLGLDLLDGGTGTDLVDLSTSAVDLIIDLTSGTVVGNPDLAGDILVSIEGAIGGAANDQIFGTTGANTLFGGFANDLLFGDAGNDVLEGGFGVDVLSGGAQSDRFVFSDLIPGGGGWGDDLITDFRNHADRIDLRGDRRVDGFSDLAVAQVDGDTVITIGDDSITLAGFSITSLDADDFLFG